MKIKKILLQFSIVLFFFNTPMFAQSVKDDNKENSDKIYNENKQNILVDFKQPIFTLKLKSNPSTGYSWFLREYDVNLIKPVKHSIEKNDQENLMGAPNYELWVFKAKLDAFIVPQQTIIRMVYARPWQSGEGSTQAVFRVSTQGK